MLPGGDSAKYIDSGKVKGLDTEGRETRGEKDGAHDMEVMMNVMYGAHCTRFYSCSATSDTLVNYS